MSLKFTFGFSSKSKTPKTKKPKVNKPKTNRIKTKVLYKDVEGTVAEAVSLRGGINPSFEVVVTIDNRVIIVKIDDNAYSCKNVKTVYRYINGTYSTNIRSKEDCIFELPPCYTPVKPDSKVKGDVIEVSNVLYFRLKKILK